MAKIRKGSISDYLLIALEKAVDGVVKLDDMTYNSWKYTSGSDINPGSKKSSMATAIRRLREKGYIEKEINERGVVLRLTVLGKDFLGKDDVWDGNYRIVIWDIPENKRRVRDLFRRRLKEWGFVTLQKSVWISQKNVTDRLRKLISELEMESYVAVIESNDPSISNILKKKQ